MPAFSAAQCMVIHMLEHGLASKQACVCLRALVLATLEMRDAMGKLLPEVLQRLAQVSATLAVAVPVLEFLSSMSLPSPQCFPIAIWLLSRWCAPRACIQLGVPPEKSFFLPQQLATCCRTLILCPNVALSLRTTYQSFKTNRYLIPNL